MCVGWKDAAEPGIITPAAPNSELAPDENVQVRQSSAGGRWTYTNAAYYGNGVGAEYDSDEDDEDDGFAVPYQQLSNMGISSTTTGTASASGLTQAGSNVHGVLPPHLRSATTSSAATTTQSRSGYIPLHLRGTSSISQSASGYVPPHMRQSNVNANTSTDPSTNDDIESVSSISNPYETGSITTGSVRGWSQIETRRVRPAFNTNAPGPARAVSGPQAIQMAQCQVNRANGNGNWARAVSPPGPDVSKYAKQLLTMSGWNSSYRSSIYSTICAPNQQPIR